jgi:hypothetical protein
VVAEASPNVPKRAYANSAGVRRRAEDGALRSGLIVLLFAIGGAVLTGCWGGGSKSGGSKRGGSINVAIVDTPNTQDQDVANQCTEQFSAVIAGKTSIDSALRNGQTIASRIGR